MHNSIGIHVRKHLRSVHCCVVHKKIGGNQPALPQSFYPSSPAEGFFYDKGENASQETEIVNGAYDADTVRANYVPFLFRRFRSGVFDVKDAPRTLRPIVENVDKITELIEVN
ncbi:histone-lysine N-methyltransferase SETMAR [Trichonephila clavipes]|nr:histone-lysine N-methyltransferase SETMAR [Trichonephila clavipes]